MNPIIRIYQKTVGNTFIELSKLLKPGGIVFFGRLTNRIFQGE